ncbi:MAG: HNH endonuclease signature motif containing protein, partial [Nakamurella sp.]
DLTTTGTDLGTTEGDLDWENTDWSEPASAFRPVHRNNPVNKSDPSPGLPPPLPPEIAGRTGNGNWRVTRCPGEHQLNPSPVTIGVVVSLQSLFGFSNTPGQLMDRSALVAADQIRDLAQQKGTLFYRLLTDEKGHLLDVTEMGRFPTRKLAMAIKFRDGMCTGPTCHTAATDCDMDHIVPHPEGPTAGINLNNACKPDHRAKTFAGHITARTGPHTTTWTTPTGHTYPSEDPALPVEEWGIKHHNGQHRRAGECPP